MALDATERAKVTGQIVRAVAWPGLTKPDVKAAIDAIDDWVEANSAAFNTALPQPFRGAASTQQKSILLSYVVQRRAGLLKVEGE